MSVKIGAIVLFDIWFSMRIFIGVWLVAVGDDDRSDSRD